MDAEQLLRQLGVPGRLKGFRYAVQMIERIADDHDAAYLLTKRLYPETGKSFHVTGSSVERDVRTLVQACWSRGDREFLDTVAGRQLAQKPTNSEFLDMTGAYLRRKRKEKDGLRG